MKEVAKSVSIVVITNVINMRVLTYLFCPECGHEYFDTRGWASWNPLTGTFQIYEVDEHYCAECDCSFYGPVQKQVIYDKAFKVL